MTASSELTAECAADIASDLQLRRQAERRRLQFLADRLPPISDHKLADLCAFWRRQAANRRRWAFHVV